MGGEMDRAKGRAKQAWGAMTGDDDLEREGRLDEAGGKVKDTAEDVVDEGKEAVDHTLDRIADAFDRDRK
jgi:uncharacterized protein YjbJ (UPF0337 family)